MEQFCCLRLITMKNFAVIVSTILLYSLSFIMAAHASEAPRDTAALEALHNAAPPSDSSESAAPVTSHDAPTTVVPLATPASAPSYDSALLKPSLEPNDYLDACRQRNLKLSEIMVWYFVVFVVLCIVFALSFVLFPIVARLRGMSAEDVSIDSAAYTTIITLLLWIVKGIVFVFLYLYVVLTFLFYLPFPWNIMCPMLLTPLRTTGSHNKLLFVLFVFHTYFNLPLSYICLWYAYHMLSNFLALACAFIQLKSILNYGRKNRPSPVRYGNEDEDLLQFNEEL